MGFTSVGPGTETSPTVKRKAWFGLRKRKKPPLAEPGVLRNEFFEAQFDPHGVAAIRTISDYHGRRPASGPANRASATRRRRARGRRKLFGHGGR